MQHHAVSYFSLQAKYEQYQWYPKATAPDTANPRAADLPRPRAAVRVTVLRRVFSEMASMNFSTALAYEGSTPNRR